MRVVVTGASGNLGTSLLGVLSNDPEVEEVVGVSRRLPRLDLPKVRWLACDVGTDDLDGAFAGADAVVHLAWQIQPSHDLAALHRTNVVGSRRVFAAAASQAVGTLVHVSSIGAYSPKTSDDPVDERWPTDGIATSSYSLHKAMVERALDACEATASSTRWVRVRPALMFQRMAASEQLRLFLAPAPIARFVGGVPLVPSTSGFALQCVHTGDVARAIATALHEDVRGAFNLAAEPVLDSTTLARLADGHRVPVPGRVLRDVAAATWHLRVQRSEPGWLDLALQVPRLDVSRARRELGWQPEVGAEDAFRDLLHGIADQATTLPTPPLRAERRRRSRSPRSRHRTGADVR